MQYADIDRSKPGVDNSLEKWELLHLALSKIRIYAPEKCGMCVEFASDCKICPFKLGCLSRRALKPTGTLAKFLTNVKRAEKAADEVIKELKKIKEAGYDTANCGSHGRGG